MSERMDKTFRGFVYFGAFIVCWSLGAGSVFIALMIPLFFYAAYKKRFSLRPVKDFSFFVAIYGWKGFTALLHGMAARMVEMREIWDKLPYLLMAPFRLNREGMEKTMHILFASNAGLIVYALLQKWFGVPAIYQSLLSGEMDLRMIGYFGHPLHYGGFISLALLLCFFLGLYYRRIYLAYLPLLVVGLILSGSRSYFLGVAGGIAGGLALYSLRAFIKGGVGIAGVVAVAFAISEGFRERMVEIFTGDLAIRFEYWRISIATFMAHPVAGIGFDELTVVLRDYADRGVIPHPAHGHNIFFHELAEGGAIGFALMVWMMLHFCRKYVVEFFKEDDRLLKAFSAGLAATFINLTLAGMFEYNFGTAAVWVNEAFFMGLAIAYANHLGTTDAEKEPKS